MSAAARAAVAAQAGPAGATIQIAKAMNVASKVTRSSAPKEAGKAGASRLTSQLRVRNRSGWGRELPEGEGLGPR